MRKTALKNILSALMLIVCLAVGKNNLFAQTWAIAINKGEVMLSETKQLDTLEVSIVPSGTIINKITWRSNATNIVSTVATSDSTKAQISAGADTGWTNIYAIVEVQVGATVETDSVFAQVRNLGSFTGNLIPVQSVAFYTHHFKDTIDAKNKLRIGYVIYPKNATNRGVWIEHLAPNIAIASNVSSDTLEITALQLGESKIVIHTDDGDFTDTVTITVDGRYIAINSIEVTPLFLDITRSDGGQIFTWTINPGNATDQTVAIKMTDTLMGSVKMLGKNSAEFTPNKNKVGNLTAHLVISAKEDSLRKAILPVQITEDRTVTFDARKIKRKVGDTPDTNLFEKGRDDLLIVFANTDPSVVSVNDGIFSYIGAGTATIIATPSPIGVADTLIVEVSEVMPANIELNEYAMTLYVPESGNIPPVQLVAKLLPENTTEKNLQWKVSNPLAAVSQTGMVSFPTKNAGKVEVIVCSSRDTTVKAICHITIKVPLRSITLSEKTITIHKNNHTALITAQLNPSNPTDVDLSWTVSPADDSSSETGLTIKPIGDIPINLSIVPNEIGRYVIKVEDSYTKLFDTCIVHIIDEVGITEDLLTLPLEVIAQELSDKNIRLQFKISESLMNQVTTLTLFDLSGQIIINSNKILTEEVNLDIPNIPSGIYYILLQNNNQRRIIPLIKNK